MTRTELAIIRWSPTQRSAGRLLATPIGSSHRGVAVFEDQDLGIADGWSLEIRPIRELVGPDCVVAEVRFLMPHAPHDLLGSGHRFRMVGGSVGKGVMVDRELTLPQRVSEFELALIG